MNTNNAKVLSIIENTFSDAIQILISGENISMTSDLYIQADPESGELQVYDDQENLLTKKVIFDWVNAPEDIDTFYHKITEPLKQILSSLANKEAFEYPCFVKPFSVNLVNDEFQVIEELLFLDDETFRLDDPLLKDLDDELDQFLTDLLSDIK